MAKKVPVMVLMPMLIDKTRYPKGGVIGLPPGRAEELIKSGHARRVPEGMPTLAEVENIRAPEEQTEEQKARALEAFIEDAADSAECDPVFLADRGRGRPRKDRDDAPVRIEKQLARKALMVAAHRNVSIAEYLSDVVRDAIERDSVQAAREMIAGADKANESVARRKAGNVASAGAKS